jgi:cytoskeleton protein RodZ
MIDLGSELRQAREAQGISLSEAAQVTRIKERYLQALETNDWAALPTPVQARGFLRNYAIYLGLDGDQTATRFNQALQSTAVTLPTAPTAEAVVRTTNGDGAVFSPRDIAIEGAGGGMPAWFSSDILIGVALALIVALVGFGLLRLVSGNSDETPAAPITPAITDSAPGPTADTGALPGAATPAAITPTFDASTGSVQLSLEATEHVWVRVTVDDVKVLEGILAPGAPQAWQGAGQIMLETANGAGLKAVINGQLQEPLGERGQPIVLAWGPSGPVTPAPTAAP